MHSSSTLFISEYIILKFLEHSSWLYVFMGLSKLCDWLYYTELWILRESRFCSIWVVKNVFISTQALLLLCWMKTPMESPGGGACRACCWFFYAAEFSDDQEVVFPHVVMDMEVRKNAELGSSSNLSNYNGQKQHIIHDGWHGLFLQIRPIVVWPFKLL